MRIIPDQLKSRNLVPFKKRHGRYKIPGMTPEHQVSLDRVDTDLSPEEQGYIRHYLGYADALLRSAEQNAASEPQEDEFQLTKIVIEEHRAEQQPREERRTAEPPHEIPKEQPNVDSQVSGKDDSSQAA
jgi:hypothetical protein